MSKVHESVGSNAFATIASGDGKGVTTHGAPSREILLEAYRAQHRVRTSTGIPSTTEAGST